MQGQRLPKVQKTEPTIKQRIRRPRAAVQQQHASFQPLKATSQQLEAVVQALEARHEQMAGELAYLMRLSKAILHEGVHASYDCRKDMACIERSLDSCNSLLSGLAGGTPSILVLGSAVKGHASFRTRDAAVISASRTLADQAVNLCRSSSTSDVSGFAR